MLDDRSYMRDPSDRPPLSALTKVMIVLGVCYALQAVNHAYIRSGIERSLALSFADVLHGQVWQIFTYQFLHGGIMHLLCNLIGLFCFGRAVEMLWGTRRMLTLFFLSGIAGGLLHLLAAAVIPTWRFHPVEGASAGTSGLLAAYCLLQPHGEIRIYFVLPVKARYVLYFFLGISAFFTLVPSDPGVAHTAHLGGLLAGIAMVRHGVPELEWLSRLRFPSFGDFISREVDPILEKISVHGIHSLTEQERKTLEAARNRMKR